MSITVLKPGMLSTFQDEGRYGYQHQGIPVAGAMDERAHRLANLLAGNNTQAATLEITLTGPTLRFDSAACLAVAGADLGATLDGKPLALNRPLIARPGAILAFGAPALGARAYLAVYGGFALEPVMDSGSTYLRSGFGGWQGRALRKDDRIGLARPLRAAAEVLDPLAQMLWDTRIYLPATLRAFARDTLRVLPGPHWKNSPPAPAPPSWSSLSASTPNPTAWATGCRARPCGWTGRARSCPKPPALAPCRCRPAARPSS